MRAPRRSVRRARAARRGPAGTTELGIDIIKVDRIRATLERFGPRFTEPRPDPGRAALRARPARDDGRPLGGQGGRLARSSGSACAASAGATSRSSGCRPASPPSACTGGPRPAPSSSGWAASPSSITHESDYAVAIAFGVRTAGGRYLFPPDIEDRLDDRERRILARIERLRVAAEAGGAADARVGCARAGRTARTDDA